VQFGGRAPGKRSRAQQRFGWGWSETDASVQRKEGLADTASDSSRQGAELAAGVPDSEGEAVQERAAAGVASGSGSALPHRDQIQASFGRHDVGQIEAHVGGEAARAAADIGAQAYATGNQVAFAPPSVSCGHSLMLPTGRALRAGATGEAFVAATSAAESDEHTLFRVSFDGEVTRLSVSMGDDSPVGVSSRAVAIRMRVRSGIGLVPIE
jgi:hypothetical protein